MKHVLKVVFKEFINNLFCSLGHVYVTISLFMYFRCPPQPAALADARAANVGRALTTHKRA